MEELPTLVLILIPIAVSIVSFAGGMFLGWVVWNIVDLVRYRYLQWKARRQLRKLMVELKKVGGHHDPTELN